MAPRGSSHKTQKPEGTYLYEVHGQVPGHMDSEPLDQHGADSGGDWRVAGCLHSHGRGGRGGFPADVAYMFPVPGMSQGSQYARIRYTW